MKKIKTFNVTRAYSTLGNLDANKLCVEYTPADIPFNLHHLTHCISDEQKEAEAALKVGDKLMVKKNTQICIIVKHNTHTLRFFGQIEVECKKDKTHTIHLCSFVASVAGRIVYNGHEKATTQIMRAMRDATNGNGTCLVDDRYSGVRSYVARAVLAGEDYTHPCHYDSVTRSGDIQSLKHILTHRDYSTTEVEQLTKNSKENLGEYAKRRAITITEEFKVVEVEKFLHTTTNSGNYKINSWTDDGKLTFSSGITVTIDKEKAIRWFNDSCPAGMIKTSYGTVRRVGELIVCGCHRIDLLEVKASLGLVEASEAGEKSETFKDKIDVINESYKDVDRKNNALYDDGKITSEHLRERARANLTKHYRQAIDLLITTLQNESVNCDHVDVDVLLDEPHIGNLYNIMSRVYKEAKEKHIERLNKIYERKLVDDEQIQADHVNFVNAALNKIEDLNKQRQIIAKFNNRVKWIEYLTFNIDRKRITNSN